MGVKRCKDAFAVFVNGAPRMLSAGSLVDDADQIVADYPANFEDVETFVSSRSTASVEQATAEPGEKRSFRKPPARTQARSASLHIARTSARIIHQCRARRQARRRWRTTTRARRAQTRGAIR